MNYLQVYHLFSIAKTFGNCMSPETQKSNHKSTDAKMASQKLAPHLLLLNSHEAAFTGGLR